MNDIRLQTLTSVPEAELAALQQESFADYEPSRLLAEVIASEAATRPGGTQAQVDCAFGVAAYRGDVLIGWTQGYREGKSQFYMLNSGVAHAERRKGVYSKLVMAVLEHSEAEGYSTVRSRHAAANVAVIIAKLRLGFLVTGFEYSEVYGPLVQLTYWVGQARRKLYKARASPIRPASE